jgi:hypothetical protein
MAINPLQPPINYAGMVPQINIGQQFAELGQVLAERQKRTQAEEVKKAYATDLQAAIDNPTQETWNQMIVKYPQQREAFTEARKGYGEAAVTNEFNQGFEVSMALENGKPEVAQERLMKIISARETSGLPTGIWKQTLNELELGNTKGAQAGVNYALTIVDPERFQKQVNARLSAVKAPSELRESVAKADSAVADAKIKLAQADNAADKALAEAKLATANAQKAQLDAKYAEQGFLADLKKKAADLKLTDAQTGSALASTKKLGYESQKAALELEALKASGGVDPVKTFEKEEKLRKEFQDRTKKYGELGTTYETMKTSAQAKNGPGDIALITGFMKMIDPGAIVRETDFALARDTAGLFERLQNQSQKLQSGQIFALDSKQRNEYVNLAKQYLDAAEKKRGEDKTALGVVVKNYKLNPDNVFGPAPKAESVEVDYWSVPGRAPNLPGADRTVEVDY